MKSKLLFALAIAGAAFSLVELVITIKEKNAQHNSIKADMEASRVEHEKKMAQMDAEHKAEMDRLSAETERLRAESEAGRDQLKQTRLQISAAEKEHNDIINALQAEMDSVPSKVLNGELTKEESDKVLADLKTKMVEESGRYVQVLTEIGKSGL